MPNNIYPSNYKVKNNSLYIERTNKQGVYDQKLCNFTPRLISEITLDDGACETKRLVLGGEHENGRTLKEIEISGSELSNFNWLLEHWGVDCNLEIGGNVKDSIRYAIQSTAQYADRQTVYAVTGWKRIENRWKFLMPGDKDESVILPNKLKRYTFENEFSDYDLAVTATLPDMSIAPKEVIYPLLAITFLTPLNEFLHRANCEPKFVLFLLGKTGTRKSTLAALFLSFFGMFTSSDLPLSFRDTANSITHYAFALKDVLTCIDDFHPCGRQEEMKLTATAQAIIRAYGDRTGRGRLRADATPMDARPPQGNAVITAEFAPDVGESGTARYFALELNPGDVDLSALSLMQGEAEKGVLRRTMFAYTEMLSKLINDNENDFIKSLGDAFKLYRDEFNKSGIRCHGRVPEIVAELRIGLKMFLIFMQSHKMITEEKAAEMEKEFTEILCDIARKQSESIEQDKPTYKFIRKLYALMESGAVSVLDRNSEHSFTPNNFIGYEDADYYYLNKSAAHRAVKKFCDEQGESFSITERGLLKALAQEKLIDTADGQNTKSVRIGDKTKRVVCLIKSKANLIADSNI